MKDLTGKPFIVNISLVPDLTKGPEILKYIEVCGKCKVTAIKFARADSTEFFPACKESGIKIIHKSPTAHVAKRMWEKGADVITLAGYEVAGPPAWSGLMPVIQGSRGRTAYANGDVNYALFPVGNSIGLIEDVPTVQALTESIVEEYRRTVSLLVGLEQVS